MSQEAPRWRRGDNMNINSITQLAIVAFRSPMHSLRVKLLRDGNFAGWSQDLQSKPR